MGWGRIAHRVDAPVENLRAVTLLLYPSNSVAGGARRRRVLTVIANRRQSSSDIDDRVHCMNESYESYACSSTYMYTSCIILTVVLPVVVGKCHAPVCGVWWLGLAYLLHTVDATIYNMLYMHDIHV